MKHLRIHLIIYLNVDADNWLMTSAKSLSVSSV